MKLFKDVLHPHRWTLMAEFYADDSGQESWVNETFVCIAGYLSNNFGNFIEDWVNMTVRNNISQIHMKDLIPLKGEYKQLKWDNNKRDEVIDECIEIIHKHKLIPFRVAVDINAWNQIPLELRKRYSRGKVQIFCFIRLISLVMQRIKRIRPNELLNIVFDTNEKFAPPRFDLFCKIRDYDPDMKQYVPVISFGDARILAPLQAADLLAWQTRKEMIQRSSGYNSTPHYKKLTSNIPKYEIELNREFYDLEELKKKFKISS